MPADLAPAPTRRRRLLVLGHHDVDGVISAARLGAEAQRQWPDAECVAATVNFHLRPQWDDLWTNLANGQDPLGIGPQAPFDGVVLADFPALPLPTHIPLWYADHHQTPYNLTAEPVRLEASYAARAARGETVLHTHADSCAQVLDAQLPAPRAADAARWAVLTDMATRSDRVRYRSLRPSEDGALAGDLLIENLSPADAGQIILALQQGQSWEGAIAPFAARLAALEATWETVRTQQRSRTTVPAPGFAVVVPDEGRSTGASVGMRLAKMLPFQMAGVEHSLWFEERLDGRGLSWQGSLGRHPAPAPLQPGLAWPDLSRVLQQIQQTLPVEGGGHPYAVGVRLYPTDDGRTAEQLYQQLLTQIPALLRPVPIDHPLADRATAQTAAATPVVTPAPAAARPAREMTPVAAAARPERKLRLVG